MFIQGVGVAAPKPSKDELREKRNRQRKLRERMSIDMMQIAARCKNRRLRLAYFCRAIHHPDRATRLRIISALGASGGDSDVDVMPPLLESLQHEDARTIQEAISGLGMLPAKIARKSIPLLEDLARRDNKQLSMPAAVLLRRLKGN